MDASFNLDGFFDEIDDSDLITSTQLLEEISTQQLLLPIHEKGPNGRFAEPVSSEQLKQQTANAVPKNTRQSNNWATGLWREWAENRNTLIQTQFEPGFPIPSDIANLRDHSMLDYWMQRFIVEIRRKDGGPYPPNTLVNITSAIQRYLRSNEQSINFYKDDDIIFSGFRKVLDAKMKELTAQGCGVKTKKADPITVDDEKRLWDSGVFSMNSSLGLSNAVFFYNGKVFGFRGYSEHIECQAEQFELNFDHTNKRKYVQFNPRMRKNLQGGLKHKRIDIDPIVHYDQPGNGFSIYSLYEKYLDLIPRKGPFYRKPLGGTDENNNLRYGAGTISQNNVRQMMKRFFEEAGIDVEGRNISNHSARVSLCTTLYNEKFSDKSVISRSKHRSSAVQQYQRENFGILNDISNALEPPIERKVSQTVISKPATCQSGSNNIISDTEHANSENDTNSDMIIHLPNCVKKVILVKDGKRVAIDI